MDFVRKERAITLSFISGKGHYDAVIDAVTRAKHSVWIATANLKELMIEDANLRPGRARTARGAFRSVLETFDELAQRGVELRMLHASLPSRPFRDEYDRHTRLIKGGMELRMCPRVHFKTVIVDGSFIYLGSANWTGAGLGAKGEGRRNFELGFTSSDEALLDEVQELYDHVWRGAACKGCKMREMCEAPIDELVKIRKP